jgi:hypothetical protein
MQTQMLSNAPQATLAVGSGDLLGANVKSEQNIKMKPILVTINLTLTLLNVACFVWLGQHWCNAAAAGWCAAFTFNSITERKSA